MHVHMSVTCRCTPRPCPWYRTYAHACMAGAGKHDHDDRLTSSAPCIGANFGYVYIIVPVSLYHATPYSIHCCYFPCRHIHWLLIEVEAYHYNHWHLDGSLLITVILDQYCCEYLGMRINPQEHLRNGKFQPSMFTYISFEVYAKLMIGHLWLWYGSNIMPAIRPASFDWLKVPEFWNTSVTYFDSFMKIVYL
jgi:hypothetical protein